MAQKSFAYNRLLFQTATPVKVILATLMLVYTLVRDFGKAVQRAQLFIPYCIAAVGRQVSGQPSVQRCVQERQNHIGKGNQQIQKNT